MPQQFNRLNKNTPKIFRYTPSVAFQQHLSKSVGDKA